MLNGGCQGCYAGNIFSKRTHAANLCAFAHKKRTHATFHQIVDFAQDFAQDFLKSCFRTRFRTRFFKILILPKNFAKNNAKNI